WDRRESNIMAFETRPSETPVGQTMNTLTALESTQGWRLLFDGKTLAGWHASVPAPASGRAGSQAPASPGQVGSPPRPCVAARDSAPPPRQGSGQAGGSHWEVVDGALTACGEPTGYLTSDRSYRNFV